MCIIMSPIKQFRSVLIILLVTKISLGFGAKTSKKYSRYSLYIAYPTTETQAKFLQAIEHNNFLDVSIWNKPVQAGKPVQIMVNHLHEDLFKEKNGHYRVTVTSLVKNIQTVFDEQVAKQDVFNPFKHKWEYFHTLEDIYKNLNTTAYNHTDIVRLEIIGRSAEGRNILALSIKDPVKHNNKVIMEAGSHGNEWLGTSFVMYFIEQLLQGQYAPLKDIMSIYNWYFIPVLNPDGYVYAQTVDRLWRKNRRNITDKIKGVDLNRNFDYKFGEFDTSNDPEDDRYHGLHEFSESESKTLRDFVDRKRDGLQFFFSFHGYGQAFIIPYADSIRHGGGNSNEMQSFAKHATDIIEKTTGRIYKVGYALKILGKKFSGDSASWVKMNYRVPFVYTILGRDDNYYGHAIPNDQILPFCTEMKIGLTELLGTTPRYLRLSSSNASPTHQGFDLCVILVCLSVFC